MMHTIYMEPQVCSSKELLIDVHMPPTRHNYAIVHCIPVSVVGKHTNIIFRIIAITYQSKDIFVSFYFN